MRRLIAALAGIAERVHTFARGQRVADLTTHLSTLIDERAALEAEIENTTRALLAAQNDLDDHDKAEKPGFFTVDRHFPDVSPRSY